MSMGANDHRATVNLDPRGMVGRIYIDNHDTLLHTKYRSCGLCDFSFPNYKSMEANDPNLDPQVHGWQDLCREPLDIAKYFILLYEL